jgi:hypothetical protein
LRLLRYHASNEKGRSRQIYEIDKRLFLTALTLATHADSLISISKISVKDVPSFPSANEWVKTMWTTNSENYSSLKKNEILSFEVT